MKSLTSTKGLIGKILALLLFFNITVLGSSFYNEIGNKVPIEDSSILESGAVVLQETVEVSLDSFNNMGILIMIALSSVLGAFFVKDAFSEILE